MGGHVTTSLDRGSAGAALDRRARAPAHRLAGAAAGAPARRVERARDPAGGRGAPVQTRRGDVRPRARRVSARPGGRTPSRPPRVCVIVRAVANYGFAIDLRKCIGCHACTIACKSEHDIPVGVNRCWVKTVEKGTFPDTQRLFLPVLCNQCERRAVHEHLPDRRALQAPRRHRRSEWRVVHRVPRVHGRVPVRPALHRSEHADGREVQLLREPDREPAAAGVRERLSDRVPHLRRHGRPDQRSRADRAARSVHGPQARKRHGPEGLLPRRGRSDHAPGDRGTAVHVQGRPGAPAPDRLAGS